MHRITISQQKGNSQPISQGITVEENVLTLGRSTHAKVHTEFQWHSPTHNPTHPITYRVTMEGKSHCSLMSNHLRECVRMCLSIESRLGNPVVLRTLMKRTHTLSHHHQTERVKLGRTITMNFIDTHPQMAENISHTTSFLHQISVKEQTHTLVTHTWQKHVGKCPHRISTRHTFDHRKWGIHADCTSQQ